MKAWLVTLESMRGARKKVIAEAWDEDIAKSRAGYDAGSKWIGIAAEPAFDSAAGRRAYARWHAKREAHRIAHEDLTR